MPGPTNLEKSAPLVFLIPDFAILTGMKKLLIVFLFSITIIPSSWALTEFGLNAGYDKQYFGSDRASSMTSLTYSGSLAFYFWKNIAFELNYSQTEDKTFQKYDEDSTQDVSITQLNNRVFTKVYGAGFRVSLGGKTSRIVPMISLGYAKQFIEDQTTYVLYDSTDSSTASSTYLNPKKTIESVFGTFILQFKITQRFTLKASVKTVFKAFEFSQAKDYLKYLVGFSWYL